MNGQPSTRLVEGEQLESGRGSIDTHMILILISYSQEALAHEALRAIDNRQAAGRSALPFLVHPRLERPGEPQRVWLPFAAGELENREDAVGKVLRAQVESKMVQVLHELRESVATSCD